MDSLHSLIQNDLFRILITNNIAFKPEDIAGLLTTLEKYVLAQSGSAAEAAYHDGQMSMRDRATRAIIEQIILRENGLRNVNYFNELANMNGILDNVKDLEIVSLAEYLMESAGIKVPGVKTRADKAKEEAERQETDRPARREKPRVVEGEVI